MTELPIFLVIEYFFVIQKQMVEQVIGINTNIFKNLIYVRLCNYFSSGQLSDLLPFKTEKRKRIQLVSHSTGNIGKQSAVK